MRVNRVRWISIASIILCLVWTLYMRQYRQNMHDSINSMGTTSTSTNTHNNTQQTVDTGMHTIILIISNKPVQLIHVQQLDRILQSRMGISVYVWVPSGKVSQQTQLQFIDSIPLYHRYHSQIIFINDYLSHSNTNTNTNTNTGKYTQISIQDTPNSNININNIDIIVIDNNISQQLNANITQMTHMIVQTNRYQLQSSDSIASVYVSKHYGQVDQKNRYAVECDELFANIIDASGVKKVYNGQDRDLYYSAQARAIMLYDTNHAIRRIASQFIQWLSTNKVQNILLPPISEDVEQTKLLQLVIALALHNMSTPIIANTAQIKKINRNMVINDVAINMKQSTGNVDYGSTVLLSTPSLLLMDIISLRKLIISQQFKVILYLHVPNHSALDDIRTEFMVTPITPTQPISTLNGAQPKPELYLVERIRNKINFQKYIEQENRPNFKFITTEPSSLSPKWVSTTYDSQTYPDNCKQLHPVISKYFPRSANKLNLLFQLMTKQANPKEKFIFYYCFKDADLFYEIGIQIKTQRIVLCSQIYSPQLKLFTKIAIINDFSAKINEQTKQNDTYDIVFIDSMSKYQTKNLNKNSKVIVKSKQVCSGTKISQQLCLIERI